jgi:5,10-methylenetetrahydromethanopterin reductase
VSVAIQTDKSVAEYREIARVVEDLGFDGLSAFADLGFQPPVPALLAAAAETSRIRLGPACLNPVLTHPVEIAGQIAALADAAGHDAHGDPRVYLGLARGSWLDRLGIPAVGGLARLAEAVGVVDLLLRGDESGYAGTHFTIPEGFRLAGPLPARRPDLLLGVWGPRGVALAGRVADEVKIGGSANPDMVRLARTRLREACLAAGRPADAVRLAVGAVTVVDRDRSVAREVARREVAMYLDVVAALDPTTTVTSAVRTALAERLAADDPAGAAAVIDDATLDRFAIAGNPTDVAEHALALFRAGADRVEFGTPHGLTGLGGIELLGRRVLPAVRAGVGQG